MLCVKARRQRTDRNDEVRRAVCEALLKETNKGRGVALRVEPRSVERRVVEGYRRGDALRECGAERGFEHLVGRVFRAERIDDQDPGGFDL